MTNIIVLPTTKTKVCYLDTPANGEVFTAKADSDHPAATVGYGYYMIIRHDGFFTLYAHMQTLKKRQGDKVPAGDIIGHMGNTGHSTVVHLYFEIRCGAAIDPAPYLTAGSPFDLLAAIQKRYDFLDATMYYLGKLQIYPRPFDPSGRIKKLRPLCYNDFVRRATKMITLSF